MHPNILRHCSSVALLGICAAASLAQDGPTGVIRHEPGALPGYTLFSPNGATTNYLIDMEGTVVHRWDSDSIGSCGYLLPDGSLIRGEAARQNPDFSAGGAGGQISRYAWDSTVLWRYGISDDQGIQHHDIEPMPNGNVLVLCWELKTRDEALEAGRDPDRLSDVGIWAEVVLELKPVGKDGAEVVWEWHLWDHLIQDLDSDRSNFGSVAASPGKVDLNFPGNQGADWTHANSLDYTPELDQIAISARTFSEAWVIDHDTTSEEAAGTAGDLIYRWGNPRAYKRGTEEDQQLFLQHDVNWIEAGLPGAGNLMAFNNGGRRPGGGYSSIDKWAPPIDADGRYQLDPEAAFGPSAASWTYTTGNEEFFSSFISGAHSLPNGNTLICSGVQSRLFEVNEEGEIVWDYINPFTAADDRIPSASGPGRQGGPPPTGIFRATRYAVSYPGVAALRDR